MDFKLSLKSTVEKYGLMAKKSLGQNFLLNQNIPDKIIRCSLEKQSLKDFQDNDVYEIGPGPGGLTRAIISNNPKKLTVVEMDHRCIQIMEDLKEETNVNMDIINADALKTDFSILEGQNLTEANIEETFGVKLFAVKRRKNTSNFLGSRTLEYEVVNTEEETRYRFATDDRIVIYGSIKNLERLKKQL